MSKCKNCHRKFPAHLIQPMFINGGYINLCPICALEIRNETSGLPKDTPFGGETAKALYEEAKEYLKTYKKELL